MTERKAPQSDMLRAIENFENHWTRRQGKLPLPLNEMRERLGFPLTSSEEILERIKNGRQKN